VLRRLKPGEPSLPSRSGVPLRSLRASTPWINGSITRSPDHGACGSEPRQGLAGCVAFGHWADRPTRQIFFSISVRLVINMSARFGAGQIPVTVRLVHNLSRPEASDGKGACA